MPLCRDLMLKYPMKKLLSSFPTMGRSLLSSTGYPLPPIVCKI